MDLEVVGRHAMLFDDDAMAAFSNSPAALVDWNSLSIDRYDVRHLLPGPLPPRPKRRRPPPPSLEADLDLERYLDLPSSSPEDPPQDNDSEPGNSSGYRAVAFSYENPNDSTMTRDNETETVFRPHFPVPENLLNNLPPNEQVHQIISKTATYVSNNGSQTEIVLRVRHGDNPKFGFLMPDHHLHAYFRYLVDHQELLTANKDDGNSSADKNRNQGTDQTGGALSLLGSVYGSGEDEDGATENTHDSDRNEHEGAVDAASKASPETEQAEPSSDAAKKDGSISKKPISSSKEKVPIIKRNSAISTVKAAAAARAKTGDASESVTNAANKSHNSVPSATKIELPIVEPPSDLKRVIEKIVEFIVKNGRQFEAVLAEQDRPHGRFPFLLPSNRYHTYYLKVLQNTEESKLSGKGSKKQNPAGRSGDNNTAVHEESDELSFGSMGSDLQHDVDRKGKFKMIIGKSKKDGQETNPKDSQSQNTVCVDATAAAAILQAATRGIKNPNLEIFSKTSSGNGHVLGSDGGHLSSSGSLYSSQLQNFVENSNLKAGNSASVPVAKAIAETVAIAAAGEADSSEAHMTKEQKLKAERLKRAKMFAAMLKRGAAPFKSESSRAFLVEPPGSGLSGSDAEAGSLVGKEREGSSVPFDVDNSDKSQKSEEKHSVDNSDGSHKSEEKLTVDNSEQKLKRKYRSRSSRHEEEGEEEEEEEKEEEIAEDKRDHKRSRKKHHRSHRSSHSSRDRHKHRRRHSSSKDKLSHKGTKHDSSSDDEHHHHSRHHHHTYDSSSDEKHPTSRRRRHREESTSDNEHRHFRRRSKHYSSSDDEERHRSRHSKHKSSSHAGKEKDLEEGEIIIKSDESKKARGVERDNREGSIGLSKSDNHASAPSQSPETTEVSDELRAKIRAMLMANM